MKFVWLTQGSFGICSLAWSSCIGFIIEFSGLWKIITIQTLLPTSSYCTLMIEQCKWSFIWNDLSRHSIDSSFRMFSNISKFTKINMCSNFCHACFSMVIQESNFPSFVYASINIHPRNQAHYSQTFKVSVLIFCIQIHKDYFTHFEPSQSLRWGKNGEFFYKNHLATCKQNLACQTKL